MNNYTSEKRGTIILGDKVMVSDPCYGLNTWCQGVLENVLPGEYECKVGFADDSIVADIDVTHKDYVDRMLSYESEEFEVGVDSGQAGIFDYEYYVKYHSDRSEQPHVDENWYDRCCDLTLVHVKNPDYEEFYCEYQSGTLEGALARFRALSEYFESVKSMKYISKLDGNTIDGLGFVSSTAYGDGGYTCYTARDNGKVVAIRIEYLTDEDYEEDYDEYGN